MRVIFKSILLISFISSYLFFLLAVTFKFQLLDANFWISSLRQQGIYEGLAKTFLEGTQAELKKEGAASREIAEIAKLFTTDQAQTFVERNITHTLDYVNGKIEKPVLYFPVSDIPKDIKEEFGLTSNEVYVEELLSKIGRENAPIDPAVFEQFRLLGNIANFTFISALITLIITLFFIYKLEEAGKRLIFAGLSLFLSAVSSAIGIVWINIAKNQMAANLVTNTNEPAQVLLGTLAPPLLANMIGLWTPIVALTALAGVALFFIKKPGVPQTTPKTQ